MTRGVGSPGGVDCGHGFERLTHRGEHEFTKHMASTARAVDQVAMADHRRVLLIGAEGPEAQTHAGDALGEVRVGEKGDLVAAALEGESDPDERVEVAGGADGVQEETHGGDGIRGMGRG